MHPADTSRLQNWYMTQLNSPRCLYESTLPSRDVIAIETVSIRAARMQRRDAATSTMDDSIEMLAPQVVTDVQSIKDGVDTLEAWANQPSIFDDEGELLDAPTQAAIENGLCVLGHFGRSPRIRQNSLLPLAVGQRLTSVSVSNGGGITLSFKLDGEIQRDYEIDANGMIEVVTLRAGNVVSRDHHFGPRRNVQLSVR